MPLNPKQRRFVAEYLRDCNATKAAIRAGYSEKSAAVQGCTLLRNPNISEAVRVAQEKVAAKVGLSVEECWEILAREARDSERASDRIAATIAALKLQHKVSEKVEHSGSVSIAVVNPYAKAGG